MDLARRRSLRFRSLQKRLNFPNYQDDFDRLRVEVIATCLDASFTVAAHGMGGESDNWNRPAFPAPS